MNAKQTGLVTRAEFQALLDRIEDLEDVLYLRSVAAETGRDYVSDAMVGRLLAGANPLREWRKHRQLTLAALAAKSGVKVSYLSEIETGKKPGSLAAVRAIAAALGVSLEDIAPPPAEKRPRRVRAA